MEISSAYLALSICVDLEKTPGLTPQPKGRRWIGNGEPLYFPEQIGKISFTPLSGCSWLDKIATAVAARVCIRDIKEGDRERDTVPSSLFYTYRGVFPRHPRRDSRVNRAEHGVRCRRKDEREREKKKIWISSKIAARR